jgi:hypothetical protein
MGPTTNVSRYVPLFLSLTMKRPFHVFIFHLIQSYPLIHPFAALCQERLFSFCLPHQAGDCWQYVPYD